MLQGLKPQQTIKRAYEQRATTQPSPSQEEKPASSKSTEDKLELSDLHPDAVANDFCKDKHFADKWNKAGWEVRDYDNYQEQRPSCLHGREVAFQVQDEVSGQKTEKTGLLIADDRRDSAIFRLHEQEGEYNNNYIRDLAVNTSGEWTLLDHNITGKRYQVRDGLVYDGLFPQEEPIPVEESTAYLLMK